MTIKAGAKVPTHSHSPIGRPRHPIRRCSECLRSAPDVTFYGTCKTTKCKACWCAYMRANKHRQKHGEPSLDALTAAWGRS